MDKFVLIDGNSLINRAFYATPPMQAQDGTPTNAVYAFMNMLTKIIHEVSPKYLLVAFDRKEPTFRHKMFTEYKGTRKPMPEDLAAQIPLLKEMLDALNIKHFELAGFEADDIIGTLSKKSPCQTIIYTGDKDSFQLVNNTTSVYFTKRGISDIDQYTGENFKEKMGISPINIIDLKALMGDSSDNIPGVKGVGEKTAISLIQTYETIENLYDHIDEIKGKLKEKLTEDIESCKMSKVLATINTNFDIPLKVEECGYDFPFTKTAKEFFIKVGFVNILKKTDLFLDDEVLDNFSQQKKSVKVVKITKEKEITNFVKSSKFALIIGDFVSFYTMGDEEYQLEIKQNFFDEGFDYIEAVCALKPIFEDEKNTVIIYRRNQILHQLESYKIYPKCKFEDVSMLKYLVDYTGKDEELSTVFTAKGYDQNTPSYSLSILYDEYFNLLSEQEKKVYYDIELPLSDVLFDMEKTGFKVDILALEKMSTEYKAMLEEIANKIYQLAGEVFNINSTKQLAEILFEKLNLTHGKKTKSGFSTSSEVLEELIDDHEIIPLILKYRRIAKLNSTYIDGFRGLIDKQTGLVHTTFNQVQTATGRLSSREPNLQNIPVRDEEGREIRRLFSARSEDRVLIDADYSQIELRLLAAFSGCKPLIDAFNSGEDIHTATASMVFGVPISQVDSHMRRSAKAVNFGIIYGISDYGLAKNLKIYPKLAGSYIKKYFELYPEVKEYMNKNVEDAKKMGYALSLFGRKRYIREISSPNYNVRSFGERAAMNMPLQGSAADIMSLAMINVYKRLKDGGYKSKLILQVHDELIIDALISEVEEVKKILVEEMENAVKLSVPLTVSVSIAKTWYEAK